MAADSAREIVEAIQQLDDDAKAAIGKELAPHIPVTLGRRQMLGVGAAALFGAGGATGAAQAMEAGVEPARAADGIVNDIDVLQSGDGTPIGFGNAAAFDHESVSSATTIGNVTYVYYDSSISGYAITIPSSLEVPGMMVRFIDQTGNADTNSVDIQNSGGGTIATIDAANSIFEVHWDTGEWIYGIFTPSVVAGEATIDEADIGDRWNPIATVEDADGGTLLDLTVSGLDTYDKYKIEPTYDRGGGNDDVLLRLNGESGTDYNEVLIGSSITSRAGRNEFLLTTGISGSRGQGGTWEIINWNNRPVVYGNGHGVNSDSDVLFRGVLDTDATVSEISIFTASENATGELVVSGRDIQ